MKVLSVQPGFGLNKNNNIKKQNFNGLWTKSAPSIDKDPVLGAVTETWTYFYHPFKDESKWEINSALDRHTVSYFRDDSSNKFVTKNCVECSRLPITKENFQKYSSANETTTLSPTIKQVHNHAKSKLNEVNGKLVPAVNEIIKYRLDRLS
jgi:tRNA(Ile)-lysidine synthase TilS/MesJ